MWEKVDAQSFGSRMLVRSLVMFMVLMLGMILGGVLGAGIIGFTLGSLVRATVEDLFYAWKTKKEQNRTISSVS